MTKNTMKSNTNESCFILDEIVAVISENAATKSISPALLNLTLPLLEAELLHSTYQPLGLLPVGVGLAAAVELENLHDLLLVPILHRLGNIKFGYLLLNVEYGRFLHVLIDGKLIQTLAKHGVLGLACCDLFSSLNFWVSWRFYGACSCYRRSYSECSQIRYGCDFSAQLHWHKDLIKFIVSLAVI